MKALILPFLSLLILLLACSTKNNKEENNVASGPAAKLYQNFCAGCHGANLEKFVHKDWMYGESTDAVFKSIKFGQIDIGMPGFEKTFDDEEIMALTKYVINAVPKKDKPVEKTESKAIHKTEELSFKVDTVVSGLEIPWGLEFLPGGDLLISERKGV